MILITGHRGFIGSLLEKRLPNVLGIDIKDGLDLLTCDLPDADIIYHLAAQTSVESSWQDPVHDMNNLRITARLIKRYPNARIIYANSAAAVDPKSPYGFSKWASGKYLEKFHADYVSCVFPNVYGKGSKSVVDIFKNQCIVTIYGDGKQTRDFVHVDDIVEGLIKAKDWNAGSYFMGSEIKTSVLQLAEGKQVIFAPERIEERESVLPNSTPNWKPLINVMEYI